MSDSYNSDGIEHTPPLQQIAAALLCYTGVISVSEARDMIGLPRMSSGFAGKLSTLASFVKQTGKSIPPVMANWWPSTSLKELLS